MASFLHKNTIIDRWLANEPINISFAFARAAVFKNSGDNNEEQKLNKYTINSTLLCNYFDKLELSNQGKVGSVGTHWLNVSFKKNSMKVCPKGRDGHIITFGIYFCRIEKKLLANM